MDDAIVVIGGGCAGLSAAVRLAQAGRPVVLLEASPRLGGRASTFTDQETGDRVDNGQHVLFGCYRETYEFLRTIGAEAHAPLDLRLSVAMAASNGKLHRLSCPRLPPPWHLIAGIVRWSAIPLSDRLSAFRLAPLLRLARRDGPAAAAACVKPDLTVTQWLSEQRQTAEICRWLWNPLAIAALNQSPDDAAAAPFVRVLTELFGPRPEDSAIGMPAVPLEELYAVPARRFIESHGGTVVTLAPARLSVDVNEHLTVAARDSVWRPSRIVAAVPWHAFSQLWPSGVPSSLASIAASTEAMTAIPIVTVNFWFDRPVMDRRFVGFVQSDGPNSGPPVMHWAFDRGTHLSLVSSGASQLARLDRQAIVDLARDQLTRSLPAVKGAKLHRAVVVREHRATFSVAPGAPTRPATRTPLSRLLLAGDWIDTGLPGTIESAIVSGHRAADAILHDA